MFCAYLASILSGVSLEDATRSVIAALPEDNIDPDSDCEIDDMEDIHIAPSESHRSELAPEVTDVTSLCKTSVTVGDGKGSGSAAGALTLLNSERSLIAFSSPAAEYFNEREFQGLVALVPEGHDTAIQMGQIGIAKSYKKYDKAAIHPDP